MGLLETDGNVGNYKRANVWFVAGGKPREIVGATEIGHPFIYKGSYVKHSMQRQTRQCGEYR